MKCVKTGRLEKLVKQLEPHTYPIDGNGRLAPTGEPYITLMSFGIKQEGACTNFFLTDIEAVDSFFKTINWYFEFTSSQTFTSIPTVYWRSRPILHRKRYEYPYNYSESDYCSKRLRKKQYTVRCRLLCSNKPIKGE